LFQKFQYIYIQLELDEIYLPATGNFDVAYTFCINDLPSKDHLY